MPNNTFLATLVTDVSLEPRAAGSPGAHYPQSGAGDPPISGLRGMLVRVVSPPHWHWPCLAGGGGHGWVALKW